MALPEREADNQGIADRLKRLRAERGNPSQKDVAREMGVAPRSYQNWEMGATTPSPKHAAKAADYYGVTREYILYGVDASVTAAQAVDEFALINQKLDRVLAALEAPATAQLISALLEAMGPASAAGGGVLEDAAVKTPPALPASRSRSKSAHATGRRRAAG